MRQSNSELQNQWPMKFRLVSGFLFFRASQWHVVRPP